MQMGSSLTDSSSCYFKLGGYCFEGVAPGIVNILNRKDMMILLFLEGFFSFSLLPGVSDCD